MLRIRAGSVHPVTAPPISDGAVLVDGGGRIAAVGPHSHVPAPREAETREFPQGVLVPGLVNCHTHLELTHLAGRVTDREFPAWIRRLRELKDATAAPEFRRAAEEGVRACWAAGVTCVADTGSTGAAASVERLRPLASDRLRLGVSPHAPYTVSAPLYRAVADFALRERVPLAVHLAESPQETQLVRDGAGPFADALRARGIAVDPRADSPVRYLVQLGVLASGNCLCIHCVQVDRVDVDLLKTAGAAIAHCPRSNRAHGHGAAPLAV